MEPCNQNVFKNGHSIATLDACMHRAETFVQAVAKESGQPVDWHYSGGIANVLYLGDFDKVKAAFDKLTPMLSDPMKREQNECGSCSGNTHREGRVFRTYSAAAHGPYRAGDEVASGTIAVVTTI
jgi:hypothetical protein